MGKVIEVGAIPTIEMEIYQREDAYFPGIDIRMTLQRKLILDSFIYHFNNNDLYKNFCIANGITYPYDIEINKIPLIPSTVFKSRNIRTFSNENTVKSCLSSGTQGSFSKVERDNTTLERFLGTVRNVIDNVYKIEDAIILNLGPSSEEAADIWFSYVMSVSDMVFPTLNYVVKDKFMTKKFVNDIKKFSMEYEDVIVIGAPIMFMELYKHLIGNNISIDFGKRILIITAGGWKKFEGLSVSKKEFKKRCKGMFHGLLDERIRDTFNMVELNSVVPDCEYGSKHLPLWLDVVTVDMETFEKAENGNLGLLAFYDASPTSYPGFIISGDLGRVTYNDNCPCGRKGKCIEVIRRINTIESRGCALKIEKNYLT